MDLRPLATALRLTLCPKICLATTFATGFAAVSMVTKYLVIVFVTTYTVAKFETVKYQLIPVSNLQSKNISDHKFHQ